jgi:tryptophanyl-tRNA synthetase
MSLVEPQKKMSKSDANLRSRILLTDTRESVREKLRRAVTDSNGSHISFDPISRPGLSNLLQIYSAFLEKDPETVGRELESEGVGIGELKERMSCLVGDRLAEIQMRMREIGEEDVRRVLREGRDKAN